MNHRKCEAGGTIHTHSSSCKMGSRGFIRFGLVLITGTNLYTKKTNLHPLVERCYSIRTIRAVDKKGLT